MNKMIHDDIKPGQRLVYSYYKKIEVVPSQRNLSILFIEDDLITQQYSQYFLKKSGCRISLAKNGKDAVSLFNSSYDLVFLDIGLPDMDGYEVARQIRLKEKDFHTHIPIIAHTAYFENEILQSCLAAGIDHVTKKLTTFTDFQKIIKTWVKPSFGKGRRI